MAVVAPPTEPAPTDEGEISTSSPVDIESQVLVEEGCLTSSLALMLPAVVAMVRWLIHDPVRRR